MSIPFFEIGELATRVGWALIHSLWQIGGIARLFAVVVRNVDQRSAQARYILGCVALACMSSVPIAWFLFAGTSNGLPSAVVSFDVEDSTSSIVRNIASSPIEAHGDSNQSQAKPNAIRPATSVAWSPAFKNPAATSAGGAPTTTTRAHRFNPVRSTAYAWLLGVTLLTIRPLRGLILAFQLRRLECAPVPEYVDTIVRDLADRMRMHRVIALSQSTLTHVPCVIGWFRPLILLPASAVTGLSPDELRAILAHELAHIRRHDFVVNLLQIAAETPFFYHPAVWWVSKFIRQEREHCCDDIALQVCADTHVYASALMTIRSIAFSHQALIPPVAMSAEGGVFSRRIDRILAPRLQAPNVPIRATIFSGLLLLIVFFATQRFQESDRALPIVNDSSAHEAGHFPSNEEGETRMPEDHSPPPSDGFDEFTATPGGICEAAREGDVATIEWIHKQKPELATVKNPHNWSRTPVLHHWPGAKTPIEIAAAFDRSAAVARLARLVADAADNPVLGYGQTMSIARGLGHEGCMQAVRDDLLARLDENPDLLTEVTEPTLMFWASSQADVPLMKALIDRGANIDAANKDGVRPIHEVIGNEEAVALLIEQGAKSDLWIAAATGDLESAKKFLDEDPSAVNKTFRPDSRVSIGLPLVGAAMHGQVDMVRLLLDRGADINAKHPTTEFCDQGVALLWAFERKHYDVVNLLLDRGASDDAWIDGAWSFKHFVTESEHQQIRDRVLSEEEKNPPPLPSPSFKPWTGILVGNIRELPPPSPGEALSAIGAALYSHNRDGSYENYKEIITVMLEQGADQNKNMDVSDWDLNNLTYDQKTWAGTLLHWLSTMYLEPVNHSNNPAMPTMAELVELARIFLQHGADIEARHPLSNMTPLSLAVEQGHLEYVMFLLEQGAKVHLDDPSETNPVSIAKRLGFREIARALSDQ